MGKFIITDSQLKDLVFDFIDQYTDINNLIKTKGEFFIFWNTKNGIPIIKYDSLEKEYFVPESLWNAIISFFPQEEPLYRYIGDWLENRLKYEMYWIRFQHDNYYENI